MAVGHLLDTNPPGLDPCGSRLGPPRRVLDAPCTPVGMDTDATSATAPTLTLSELAAFLSVRRVPDGATFHIFCLVCGTEFAA